MAEIKLEVNIAKRKSYVIDIWVDDGYTQPLNQISFLIFIMPQSYDVIKLWQSRTTVKPKTLAIIKCHMRSHYSRQHTL